MSQTALVIGGGFGGMAAALRLRARGYAVTLVDRCAQLGGRAQVFEQGGYRHDAGPTVITAAFLFKELFELFDRRLDQYLTLVDLNPWYRFIFPDGRTFDYGGTVEDTLAEIARFNPDDQRGYQTLVAQSKQIFDVGFTQLADAPFHRFASMVGQMPNLLRLGARRSVWSLVAQHLKDPHLRQAFSIQPLLVGGNPFSTTSIYGLIHYLEREWGIQFAIGGTGAIVAALERLMRETGIAVRLKTTVSNILVENGTATGVRLDTGENLRADIVVSNADAAHLYSDLLPKAEQTLAARAKMRMARYSMSLFVLFFGTARQYPNIAHHTIWLGRRYKALLHDIFSRKVLADDFSLYLHRPTATDPSFAPPGHDSFYVLAPVPNLQGQVDWSHMGPVLRNRIVAALDQTLLPGLKHSIREDFFMTPEDFRTDYLSVHGAGFSIAPHLTQSAWFRFHNKAEGPRNLYLVGAGTHPGAGLPGVLCSAKVLDRLIPHADAATAPNAAALGAVA